MTACKVWAALLAPFFAAAQAASEPPEKLCSLEGKVVNALTGDPVAKVSISLNRADLPSGAANPAFGTVTDASGRFVMARIPPGRYRLRAFRSGFAELEYGSRGQGRPGAALSLAAGEKTSDLTFRLTPYAIVSGRVTDEDGEPVSPAAVQFLRYRYSAGKRTLSSAGAANSIDTGEYQGVRLLPGKYIVAATYRAPWESNVDRSAEPRAEEGYAVTYYPGVTDPAAAVQIEIGAGEQLRGIDVTLRKARALRIAGRVVNTALPGATPNLTVFPATGSFNNFSMRSAAVNSRGEFEIRGVTPGSYWLMASVQMSNYSNYLRLTVSDADIDGVVVTLGPGVAVAGRLAMEGEAGKDLSNVQIRLERRQGAGVTSGMPPVTRPGADLGFRFEDVSPDQYDVLLYPGLPEGLYLKSIRCGDADVLAAGLNASASPDCALEILVSPKAGEVDGVGHDADDKPAPGSVVALLPQEKERRERAGAYLTATTDQYGRFSLKSVPPGQYKVYAWEDVETGAWFDPDFMKPIENRGETVAVRESGHESIRLKWIPAESPKGPRKEPNR